MTINAGLSSNAAERLMAQFQKPPEKRGNGKLTLINRRDGKSRIEDSDEWRHSILDPRSSILDPRSSIFT